MNIDIHAITVCVNYAHLFKHCIKNKLFFKRWVIITTEEDTDTINLCKENNLEYIISKTLYNRQFSKGEAINEAMDYLGYNEEWYLHIDADVLLPDNFGDTFPIDEETGRVKVIGLRKLKCVDTEHMERTGYYRYYEEFVDEPFSALNLYTMGRVNVDEEEDFEMFVPQQYFNQTENIVQKFKGYGYFQLFHLPSLLEVYPDLHHIYPSMSKNAGHDDWIFSKIFYQIISLDSYCVHLSPEKINWDGI
ncbi:hypothetical protein N8579_00295 [bacterium]|jgi:hypothetical protein|nr:hypothetical protein [bacterium]